MVVRIRQWSQACESVLESYRLKYCERVRYREFLSFFCYESLSRHVGVIVLTKLISMKGICRTPGM